jgi:hypothetical protein
LVQSRILISLREILFKKQILSKINYSKTPRVLSMRDNWERGVELSSGEYLSIIGDDDAVLPDAFLRANIIFFTEADISLSNKMFDVAVLAH